MDRRLSCHCEAVVTHLHQDHYAGIVSLCNLLPVKSLALYEGYSTGQDQILKETGLKEKQLLYMKKGDSLLIEEGVKIDILYPEKKSAEEYKQMQEGETDENGMTLVLRLDYDKASVLLTGDLGFKGEEEIVAMYEGSGERLAKADILKVGHHGSKYASGDPFLDLVNPRIAVIQVGENNNFGHPNADVIEKLEKKDIIVRRTDLCGAIMLDVKDGDVRIRTML